MPSASIRWAAAFRRTNPPTGLRLSEINAYNLRVREELDRILSDDSQASASHWQYPRDIILNVAIEHRLMHAETLAYMLHQLPAGAKDCAAGLSPHGFSSSPAADRCADDRYSGGRRPRWGFREDANRLAGTTSLKIIRSQVPAFAIDAYKVTNGEFLKFVREGGYDDQRFWSDSDWAWIKEQNIGHPRFWRERQGQWFYQGMFEEVPLPLDWPVYVSHAEAAAYARFVGKSLPTEAQFHRAAYGTPEGVERAYPWGDAPPDVGRGNFDFQRWDPVAVGSYPGGRSAFGVEDALGNGWEWTSSLFAPFPGFEPFPFYRGYSANFFDGKHYVMKGASPRTAACMLRRSFRNWFQPHYPFVYASFRCVSN